MSISLESICRGKALRAPRIVLLGTAKVGKSTWAAGAPDPIFLPIVKEEGLDEIESDKFPPAASFPELLARLELLAGDGHDFKTVVIDSASALQPLIFEQTCQDNPANGKPAPSIEKVNGGFGKGYIEALKYWRDLTTALDYLRAERGMGCILIGHVTTKTFNDPVTTPYDRYQWDIDRRAADELTRWADATLFATRKVYSSKVAEQGGKAITHGVGQGERVLYTEERAAHPGGTRYRGLPFELTLDPAAFWTALGESRKR